MVVHARGLLVVLRGGGLAAGAGRRPEVRIAVLLPNPKSGVLRGGAAGAP